MIQKDPRYRYQSAKEVAVALENYVAKAPKPVNVGVAVGSNALVTDEGSSSISLDEVRDSSLREGDTLSSKVDDTLSSSKNVLDREISELTSNQSGRLVSVKPRPDLMDGSFIDLQVESGYVESESELANSGNAQANQEPTPSGDDLRFQYRRRKQIDPLLLAALVTALFIIAVTLGFLLARVIG